MNQEERWRSEKVTRGELYDVLMALSRGKSAVEIRGLANNIRAGICEYHTVIQDGVSRQLCVHHGRMSRHSVHQGPNRPCLQNDPLPERFI